MKRATKNILMAVAIILIGALMFFTVEWQINSSTANSATIGTPSSSADGSAPNGDAPEMPSGENGGTPPSGDSSSTPPELPSGDTSNGSDTTENSQNQTDGSNNSNGENAGTPPEMPSGSQGENTEGMPAQNGEIATSKNSVSAVKYLVFGAESVLLALILIYLIMSKFNKKGFKQTIKNKDKVIVLILATAILAMALTLSDYGIASNYSGKSGGNEMATESSSANASGATTIDGTEETLNASYSSTTADENAILVENGGNATIDGATVSKESGDSSNTENSEFYGINSAILVTENSTATIKNATISTSATGANAVFATGENAKIYISDSSITSTGSSSARGLDATYGGYIEADNVSISTEGGSCASLATDRGEGTIIAKNCTLKTSGSGSPLIYSTGDISVSKSTGTALGSQIVVVEGKNSANILDSDLTAYGTGNRGETDQAGIMIYQSMSGDAGEGEGTFTAKNSTLSLSADSSCYKTAPMFFVTNTDASINLTSTTLNFGSGILLSAKGTSEWGTENSNGGNVSLSATDQKLVGNIEADKISTVTMTLSNSSYKGTINADNSAKEIAIKLDSASTLTLTGDSYVTSLDDANSSYENINFNGYTLYVNGTAING